MPDRIYLATHEGLVICERASGKWQISERALGDQHVTSVIVRGKTILAGTKAGMQRSSDGGASWQTVNDGLTNQHIRWLAYNAETGETEFAGTEPAGIFSLRGGEDGWEAHAEVPTLRDEHGWMLPYSPEAGCVRGFSFHGQRVYAAVEVGGVLRSDDGGRSWALVPGSDGNPGLGQPPDSFVYPDVHDIAVHPADPELVFAPTGGGLYRSRDGGELWELLYDCYCRAIWLDADNADHIILGPADYVGAYGRIEQSHDGGQTWQLASEGQEVPWSNTMPERFAQVADELFAVLDDGHLLVSSLESLKWKRVVHEAGKVNAVAG